MKYNDCQTYLDFLARANKKIKLIITILEIEKNQVLGTIHKFEFAIEMLVYNP